MSIEQTSQLLQLILNSVLLLLGCILLLNWLGLRQAAIEEQQNRFMHQGAELLESDRAGGSRGSSALAENRWLQIRKYLRQLQQRYQILQASLLAAHSALVLAIGSTLTLALRTLLNLDWLIPLSLSLFVVAVVVLLGSVLLVLVELYQTDRSLGLELTGYSTLNREMQTRFSTRSRQSRLSEQPARSAVSRSRSRSSWKARVS